MSRGKNILIKNKELIAIFTGFLLTYFFFLPIKGDMFSHFPYIYFYLLIVLILCWLRYFTSDKFPFGKALKITASLALISVLFPVASFLYNGRMHFVMNAAYYNYPTVLRIFLDTSNQEELDNVLRIAKQGEENE